MRLIILAAIAFCLSAPAIAEKDAAESTPANVEVGVYRHGATYAFFAEETSAACQAACDAEGICLAWSHVSEIGDGPARCELKRGVGRKSVLPGAVSGTSTTHALFADWANGPDGLLGGPGPDAPTIKPEKVSAEGPES